MLLQRGLDTRQFGIPLRVRRLLPGLGPLEGDVVIGQQPPGPLPADRQHPHRVVGQIADQLAQAPVGERAAELLRSGGGRRDQELLVLSADPAGTATRPARVRAFIPTSLNRWIPSRTVSSSAATSRAIAGTVFPLAEASTTIARR